MRFYIVFTFLLAALICHAQEYTKPIKGRVTDKDSKQPLEGVGVMIVGTNPPQGTVTDNNGVYRIDNVKAGRHSIKFTYVGYQDVLINELQVVTGKETVLNIEMQEKVTEMTEVEIKAEKDKTRANNSFATISARSFSMDESKRYAATLNDPARMVQSFAGVVSGNDETNAIVVRGNSPKGLLWRMEGIEIPNPNHFAGGEGSTGGGVSMLSANMLSNTDFYTGAFPGEYGNALSGVFDLNLRKGNTDKREYAAQIGILGLEASLEGPFSKKYKGSYLVNYRYSTLDILSLMGFKIGGNVIPKYQDLSFNFFFPTKKMGRFTFFGLGGISSLGEKAVRDTTEWQYRSDRTEFKQGQYMGVTGLTHVYDFGDGKTYLKTVLSYSYTNNSSSEDTVNAQFTPYNTFNERYIYHTVRGNVVLNRKVDSRNTIRAGAIFSHMRFKLYRNQYSYFTQQTERVIDNNGSNNMVQAYWQWKHRFTDNFNIISGMHFTYSMVNNKVYVEPRLGGEWKFKENMALSFGAGLHSRTDAVSTYVSYVPNANSLNQYPNKSLDFSRAFHVVGGYDFVFLKDFRLKTELYFQYLFNIPIGKDSADETFSAINLEDGFVNLPLSGKGRGYNYGAEITVEKFFSKGYYFMLSVSLFDSKYKAAEGKWRNTVYNCNYVMNALGGKEFVIGKRKLSVIGANGKIVWRGGQRFIPIDLDASRALQQPVYDYSRAYEKRLADYFRIDIGFNYRRNKKKYSWILSFDAQNVINRKNIARIVYNPETGEEEKKVNLGIIPIISWKIEF